MDDRIYTPFACYLTLPVTTVKVRHEAGPNLISYAVTQTIDATSLEPLTDSGKMSFKSTLESLNLRAPHTNIMVKDKPKGHQRENDAEDLNDNADNEVTQRSKKRAKKRHLECLECGTTICQGKSAVSSVEPELMLLGYGRVDSYGAGY